MVVGWMLTATCEVVTPSMLFLVVSTGLDGVPPNFCCIHHLLGSPALKGSGAPCGGYGNSRGMPRAMATRDGSILEHKKICLS